ncbi:MAG TPA: hypothetical protein VFP55_12460 [Solirubrobacteraceae bacterium]|nr:hypothetical protein [Solirubrobacteraceae bacterium]
MRSTKRFLWPIVAIGVALIVTPFAISLPSKASHGQTMIDQFGPIMRPASVKVTADYYNRTFVPLGAVATGGSKAATELPSMMGALAKALHASPAQVQNFMGGFPAMAGLLQGLPKLKPIFANVPPGLAHYLPLVRTMQANVGNYASIASLPNFRLFTWFFVIPGVLLVLLAGWPLLAARHEPVTAPIGIRAA